MLHGGVPLWVSAVATKTLGQATDAQDGQEHQEDDDEDPRWGPAVSLPHVPSPARYPDLRGPGLSSGDQDPQGTMPCAHLRAPEKNSVSGQQFFPQHCNPSGQVLIRRKVRL